MHLAITNMTGGTRHGVYLHATGTANNRGNIIDSLQIRDCSGDGINLTAASDSYIANCHVGGSDGSGYRIASGNTKIVNCKSYYSDTWGFWISSGRGILTGCESQDDSSGFFFDSAPWTVTGITIDTADVTGIRVSTDRLVINGCNVFLRGGGRYADTNVGILFDAGANDSIITGQVDNSGITVQVSGTPGVRSFVRLSNGVALLRFSDGVQNGPITKAGAFVANDFAGTVVLGGLGIDTTNAKLYICTATNGTTTSTWTVAGTQT
jgi:hypothetical protein